MEPKQREILKIFNRKQTWKLISKQSAAPRFSLCYCWVIEISVCPLFCWLSLGRAGKNLYEETLIIRKNREEQQCEMEAFLLNLDEKLWQLFIFVSGSLHQLFLLSICFAFVLEYAVRVFAFFVCALSCAVLLNQFCLQTIIQCLTLRCLRRLCVWSIWRCKTC